MKVVLDLEKPVSDYCKMISDVSGEPVEAIATCLLQLAIRVEVAISERLEGFLSPSEEAIQFTMEQWPITGFENPSEEDWSKMLHKADSVIEKKADE